MSLETRLVWSKRLRWKKYFRPQTIAEALRLLEEYRGQARIVAGGTDLLPQIRRKEIAPDVLVDITRISGLDEIRFESGLIKIGALVTHSQVAQSTLIQERGLALSEGASQLGSPQIRNVGTVAGNIVSGQPGADTAIPLLALNAVVKVASREGDRAIPLTEFFIDTGKTAVDSTREMVIEIFFPARREMETSVSLRLAKREALALPILVTSIFLSADLRRKKFHYGRIALGPVAPVPFRVKEAERLLVSAPITDEVIREVAQKAAEEAKPRSSPLRGSEGYRRAMVANLVVRGIRRGIERLEILHV